MDDLAQALRNRQLKMWRPKDRSMTVIFPRTTNFKTPGCLSAGEGLVANVTLSLFYIVDHIKPNMTGRKARYFMDNNQQCSVSLQAILHHDLVSQWLWSYFAFTYGKAPILLCKISLQPTSVSVIEINLSSFPQAAYQKEMHVSGKCIINMAFYSFTLRFSLTVHPLCWINWIPTSSYKGVDALDTLLTDLNHQQNITYGKRN